MSGCDSVRHSIKLQNQQHYQQYIQYIKSILHQPNFILNAFLSYYIINNYLNMFMAPSSNELHSGMIGLAQLSSILRSAMPPCPLSYAYSIYLKNILALLRL